MRLVTITLLSFAIAAHGQFFNTAPGLATYISNNSVPVLPVTDDLVLRLRAGSLNLADQANVTMWTDESVMANDAYPLTGYATYSSTYGAVLFSGDVLRCEDAQPLSNNGQTIIAAVNAISASANDIVGVGEVGGANSYLLMLFGDVVRGHIWTSDDVVTVDTMQSVTLNERIIVSQRYNPATGGFTVGNGTYKENTTGSGSLTTSPAYYADIGARGDAGVFFDGYIYEVLIYNRALSDAEMTLVEEYMSATYPLNPTLTVDLMNGLAHYWPMETQETGTDANMVSGNSSLDMSSSFAGPGATGKIDDCYTFDGTGTDIVDANVNMGTPDAFTISVWVKPHNSPLQTYPTYIDFTQGTYFNLAYDNTTADFHIYIDYGQDTSTTYSGTGFDYWYHLVYVFDNVNCLMKTYLNGVYQSTDDYSGNGARTLVNIQLVSLQYAVCEIDELGLWSRALNTSEVTELYNSGAGITYPF